MGNCPVGKELFSRINHELVWKQEGHAFYLSSHLAVELQICFAPLHSKHIKRATIGPQRNTIMVFHVCVCVGGGGGLIVLQN